jgi:hypothetical protein
MRHLNRFLLVSALAAATAVTDVALACEIDSFVSTKSRDEVAAELNAFKASGVNPWSGTYNPAAYMKSARTSDEVQAEFLASRRQVEAFLGEDSGSAHLAANPRIKAPVPVGSQLAATQ